MASATVSGTELRQSVGAFPSGVTVVTTSAGGVDHGLTVSAFVSLSLEPAMVLVSIDNSSRVLPFLQQGAPVAVSVLAEEQKELAITFGRHLPDKFDGVSVERGDSGVPVLSGAAAWFEGTVAERFAGGDHVIVTIAVEKCGNDQSLKPLLYHRGKLFDW